MFESADRNNDNRISYKEAVKFIKSMTKKKKKSKDNEVKPFNAFDHGKSSIRIDGQKIDPSKSEYKGKY